MDVFSWLRKARTRAGKDQTSDQLRRDQTQSPTASSSGVAPTPTAELPFSSPVTPGEKDIDVEKTGSEKELGDSYDTVQELDGEYVDADKKELTPMESSKWDVSGDRSPFPEVQACVSTEDDVGLEVNSE